MYKMLESSWGKYDLEPQYHGAVHIKNQVDEMHVINRRTGDIFVVKPDYSCWCEGARCWQQNYCGHHCPHSITTCVRHITDCSSDKNGLYNLMVSALSICNPVWLRSTYDNKELPANGKVPLPPKLKISSVIKTCDNNSDEGKQFVHRFKNVIDFVPNIAIEKALHELERLA